MKLAMKLPEECSKIEEVREAIDRIDGEIIKLLGQRFKYVKEIVRFKSNDRDSIVDKPRYDEVLKKRREMAIENGLDPDIIEDVYKNLIHHFIEEEIKLMSKK